MIITFIVFVILGGICGFIYGEVEKEEVTTTVLGMLIAAIVWFILFLGWILCCADYDVVPKSVETIELVSLKDRYEIDGYIEH